MILWYFACLFGGILLAIFCFWSRSMSDGEHRKSDPQDSGSAPQVTSSGAGASATVTVTPGSITCFSNTGAQQAAAAQNSIQGMMGQLGGLANVHPASALQQALLAQQSVGAVPMPFGGMMMTSMAPPSMWHMAIPSVIQPPKLENGGIQVGEIIAWRWWNYEPNEGYLLSITNGCRWPTKEPLKASAVPNGTGPGIYAFRTEQDAINDRGGPILGRVMLWGTVVEYERGFTAEYAKIVSLDRWTGAGDQALIHIRRLYGVPEDGSLLENSPIINKSQQEYGQ